jgi:hypothetical protein
MRQTRSPIEPDERVAVLLRARDGDNPRYEVRAPIAFVVSSL